MRSRVFSVSDGRALWSWMEHPGAESRNAEFVDINACENAVGRVRALGYLLIHGLEALTPTDPYSPLWKDIPYRKQFVTLMQSVGEEALDNVVTRVYEIKNQDGSICYKFWYGRDDGILRRSEYPIHRMRAFARKVTLNPKVNEKRLFSFEPAKNDAITDDTPKQIELLRLLEDADKGP